MLYFHRTFGAAWPNLALAPINPKPTNQPTGGIASKVTYHTNGLIHHPWLNHDQQLKGNSHEQANADRNDRLDIHPNGRVGEKLVWIGG
ncbi:hypothetical protein AVEN_213194-1 [Araneus ventricosus]|uniref:Uncharacterized protein n=1 Tax=Araneus ventricosus TaxID=182803 RepID=A0A4Y2VCU5_ARAVE|nr:hypothetical protein AVEN_213194-1 [Araneus ventricosus]